MKAQQLVREKRADILRVAAAYGARNVRLFGSAARGDDTRASDVDILVAMDEGRGLFDLVALWQDLEDLLGCKVDLLTDGGISPYLVDRIYAEAVPL